MIVGTTLHRLDGNPYYSPEFGRGGLAATFAVDVTQVILSGGGTLDIEVATRNSEDTTWSSAGSFSSIASTGASSLDVTGLKEIVRFKVSFGTTTTATDAAHFLMQPPSWRPY